MFTTCCAEIQTLVPRWLRRVVILLLVLGAPTGLPAAPAIIVSGLRCEYRQDPLGIDALKPRLSWVIEAESPASRGVMQAAWQVLVASTPEQLAAGDGDLWDSGKVVSDQQLGIAYAGKPLASRMRCHWKVRVWQRENQPSAWSAPAIWSIGLLDPVAWQAQWIAAEARRVSTPHNGYQSAFAGTPDAAKWVLLDLGQSHRIDGVRLWPARPFDWQPDTPGFLFPLRFRIEVADQIDFAGATTVVDRTGGDVPNPGAEPLTCRFEPVAARYLRLTATRLRARDGGNHALALAELQVLAGTENVAEGAAVTALDSIEQAAWSKGRLTDGRVKPEQGDAFPAGRPASMLRREFAVAGSVRKATLHVTGLGLYEVFLNGRRVGDGLLAPECTRYVDRVQYRAFDVTEHVRQGANAVAALLGDGWHGGPFWGDLPVAQRKFGGQRGLLARLDVELENGGNVTIVTDSAWRASEDGPLRSAGIYAGEIHDARMERAGWDQPGFDDSRWKPAVVVGFPGTRVVAQPNEPIRVTRELTPVKMTEPKPGVHVFDLGQNMVGWCQIKIRGAAPGSEVTLQHGEMLNEDGTVYFGNLRGAPQVDVFRCKGGGEEVFEPHFTYHGFRYVEVRGLPGKPQPADLLGRVFHSAAEETGRFECSNELINRLVHNAFWSQLGNLMSIPTDCPQRDERAGWMGDIQAFSQTAIFHMNMDPFFTKWLADVRDSQLDDGRFTDISPHPGERASSAGAPAWADAGVVVPWRVYENYADTRMLEMHVEAARRWVDFVHRQNPDLLWLNSRGSDYGDWLNGDTFELADFPRQGSAVPKEVLATAIWHQSTRMVAKMFAALGRMEEAAKYHALADGIRRAFNERFVAADGRILGDTQAGCALALRFGLLDDARQVRAAKYLIEAIGRYHGHLSTGIQSTHHAMLALSEHGHHDVADRLMNLRTVPSWGYTIEMGATTIWERWDGYVKGRGFQNPDMNSFNHWALGAVAEWVWRNIGGLNPDDGHPGWKQFTIAPLPCESVSWARAEYRSIRGPVRSDWRVANGRIALKVSVPPNTSATVRVPTTAPEAVTESGQPAGQANGVTFLSTEEKAVLYQVGSGDYAFEAPWATGP